MAFSKAKWPLVDSRAAVLLIQNLVSVVSRHILKVSARLSLLWTGSESAWLHALTEADLQRCTTSSVTVCLLKSLCITHSWWPVKGVYISRVRLVIICVTRTYYVTTGLQLLFTTGRSGHTTSQNLAGSHLVSGGTNNTRPE